jgi:hypothetical protein
VTFIPCPDIDPHWHVPNEFESVFDWRFDEGRTTLMHLYQKGKDMQWDAVDRIDWELDLDPENPMEMPDEAVSIYGSDVWNKMNKSERGAASPHPSLEYLAVSPRGAGRASRRLQDRAGGARS